MRRLKRQVSVICLKVVWKTAPGSRSRKAKAALSELSSYAGWAKAAVSAERVQGCV